MWDCFFKQFLTGTRLKKGKALKQFPIALNSSLYPGIVHFHLQKVLSPFMHSLIHSLICSFIYSFIIHLPNLCCMLVMHQLAGKGHTLN